MFFYRSYLTICDKEVADVVDKNNSTDIYPLLCIHTLKKTHNHNFSSLQCTITSSDYLDTKHFSVPFQKGWGERTDQSESAACPPHPLSHTIDMAFGDWSCHLSSHKTSSKKSQKCQKTLITRSKLLKFLYRYRVPGKSRRGLPGTLCIGCILSVCLSIHCLSGLGAKS
jgi:hypothetical protein